MLFRLEGRCPVSFLFKMISLLLLLSAVGCEPDTGQVQVMQTESVHCPGQGETRDGLAVGQCRLSEQFQSDEHRCQLNQTVQCPNGDTYVSEGSVCIFTPELVQFTCKSGSWTVDAQDYADQEKRGLLVRNKRGAALILAGLQVAIGIGSLLCNIFCSGKTVVVIDKPPVISACPGKIDVTALVGTTTTTAAIWTIPTATDPEGKEVTVERIYGQDPGTTFKEGDTFIGYRARDVGGAESYCWFTVSVTVIRCFPRPRFIEHGTYTCNQRVEDLYGSVCTYSCTAGYKIEASNTMTCLENGVWSSTEPKCSPVSCGDPGSITSGSYLCPDLYVFPKLCYVTCDTGYRQPSGPPFIRCTDTGQWTPALACKDAVAPKFPNGCPPNMNLFAGPLEQPVAVTWDDPAVNDNSDFTLTSSLTKGSELDPGFHVIRLTVTDTMGLSTSCNFIVTVDVKRCDYPSRPSNSRLSCTHGYVEGSQCTVTCDPGYNLLGIATLTCLNSEMWDVDVPSCTAMDCGTPPTVEFGAFDGGIFHYPARLRLSCDLTFNLKGEQYLYCQNSGTWSQSDGRCLDKQPPTFPQGCTENVEVYAASLGQPTPVDWNPPTTEDNSGGDVTLVSSVAPGSPFSLGVTSVTYTATDPSGNTAECRFSVTVTTLTCPSLAMNASSSTHLRYDCLDKNVLGAVCTPRCNSGFPLLGADNVTCQRDNITFPPTMYWSWDTASSQPECIASSCPNLTAPINGSLACYQGNFGQKCQMSCQEMYDVPSSTTGVFECGNNDEFWIPTNVVPNCTDYRSPFGMRLSSTLFYFTGNCSTSKQEIRESFIAIIHNSTYSDECTATASCVADNIKEFKALSGRIFDTLVDEARAGHFNFLTFTANERQISRPTMIADCPPGTLFKNTALTFRFSCAGCSRGHFLSAGATACQQCPVGSYTPLDDATACTPCPAGWSTPTTASTDISDCQEMCRAGQFSDDGFVPCQPCPPGQYQSRERGMTCDLCPASTWTNGSASGLDQCVPADAHLSNGTSVIARARASLTSLTLTSFLHLGDLAALNANFTFADSSRDPIYVYLYTQNSSSANVPGNSNTVVSALVEAKKWSSLVLTSDASGGQTSISLNNSTLFTRSTPPSPSPSPSLPAVLLTITPLEGKVEVSGLFGAEDAVKATDPGKSSADCNGDVSSNLLTWSLSPTALQTPSKCDAVDACLSSPCSSGHGECEDLRDGYLCTCRDGWSGPTCHLPPGACYLHQCQNAATCLEPQGAGSSYSCLCAQGFSGQRCDLVKVDGELGAWLPWSNCTAICEGQQHRQRLCINPAPLNGGDNCTGAWSQTQPCGDAHCPVDGGWGAWDLWTPCSASCAGGDRVRQRLCNNPKPQYGGNQCLGDSEEREACNTEDCPVDGEWGAWLNWSTCTVTCGIGTRSRDRSCDRPAPANGGALCVGSTNETEACVKDKCPVCRELYRTVSILLSCDDWMTPTPDPVTCNVTCVPGHAASYSFPQYQCGTSTNYLWNTQLNHTGDVLLPVCSVVTTAKSAQATQKTSTQTRCDVNENNVKTAVSQDAQQLPCAGEGCKTTVTTTCEGGSATGARSRRSIGTLNVLVHLNMDFGKTVTFLNDSDPAAIRTYVDLFNLVDRSVALFAQNQTGSLFNVTIDGKVVQPDVTSVTYNTSLTCPTGSTGYAFYCVPCSPGTKEEGGLCVVCPIGQYQDTPGSTSCKACPAGLAYDLPRAVDIRQCVFPFEDRAVRSTAKDVAFSIGVVIGIIIGVIVVLCIAGVVAACIFKNKGTQAGYNPKRPLSAKVHPSRPVTARSIFPVVDEGPAEPSIPLECYGTASSSLPPFGHTRQTKPSLPVKCDGPAGSLSPVEHAGQAKPSPPVECDVPARRLPPVENAGQAKPSLPVECNGPAKDPTPVKYKTNSFPSRLW